jgi:hypothetical protein
MNTAFQNSRRHLDSEIDTGLLRPDTSKALWDKALKESYHLDSRKILRSQVRDVAVVNAFRSMSEKFGDLPAGWAAFTTYQGNDYYANSHSLRSYAT